MSAIEWTDRTWNPVRGCSRVSEGCRNCYAERQAVRFPWGAPYAKSTTAGPRWTGRVELIPSKLDEPLRWRKPARVFVNSMSDLFHEKLSNGDIARVFDVMQRAGHHTFQVLTKRPARLLDFCSWAAENSLGPLPNVWLGVSVEDQRTADERIPLLLETPAAVRFVSLEPCLGPVDLVAHRVAPRLDWLIVGGESGPGARPFDLAWARSVVRQCREAGVPCFYKQGGASNRCEHNAKGGHFDCFPPDLQVREFPRWR